MAEKNTRAERAELREHMKTIVRDSFGKSFNEAIYVVRWANPRGSLKRIVDTHLKLWREELEQREA